MITTVVRLTILSDSQLATKKTPNAALQTLFKKLSTSETHKCVDTFFNKSSNGTNTKELLDMLYQKNTVNGVQTIYNCPSDIHSVENVTIEEDCSGRNLLDELVFDLPNTMTLVSAVASPF